MDQAWWRQDMEALSDLLALCEGNLLVIDGHPLALVQEFHMFMFIDMYPYTVLTPVVPLCYLLLECGYISCHSILNFAPFVQMEYSI